MTFISTVYSFGADGQFEKIESISLPKFSVVRHITSGLDFDGAVIEEPDNGKPQKCVSLSRIHPGYFYIDKYSRPLSKKFGIGSYYYDDGRKADPETVSVFILLADEAKKKEEKERNEKNQKDQQEIRELPGKFPYLTPIEKHPKKSYFGSAIFNIRKELKRSFPNVKFSVRKDNSSINIDWTDGPTVKQVSKITAKYDDHQTDFSGDFLDYTPTNFNRVFGGSKFIFEHRKVSPEAYNVILKWAKERFAEEEKHHESNRNLYGCNTPENLAYRLGSNYEINIPIKVVETGASCGLNAPEVFWKITGA